jgi:SAM-dependent methyltransferase
MLSGLRSRLPLGDRADAVELLDEGHLSDAEVDANLADLARLNRLPSGTRASIRAISSLGADRPRVLDVGTGRGDMPIAFARLGWPTVAVDTNPAVLEVARRVTAREPLVDVIEADGRRLPFEDAAFDVAHASLLAHHLDRDELVDVLVEMRRVSRRGVVVNDLRRGLMPLLVTAATATVLGRSRVTRVDGIISARRSHTVAELDECLGRAGLVVRWRSPAWMPRVVTAAASP